MIEVKPQVRTCKGCGKTAELGSFPLAGASGRKLLWCMDCAHERRKQARRENSTSPNAALPAVDGRRGAGGAGVSA